MLLESKIATCSNYDLQMVCKSPPLPLTLAQNTLVVWKESDGRDLALSFQEEAGCQDIWRQILHVRHPHVCRV